MFSIFDRLSINFLFKMASNEYLVDDVTSSDRCQDESSESEEDDTQTEHSASTSLFTSDY